MKTILRTVVLFAALCVTPAKAEGEKAEKPKAKPSPAPARETAPRTVKKPWLGVATKPVDPAVREHLELPPGFGIEVDYVAEDSPAATAGIREHDIMVRLDDQRLTSPEHLAVLVHSLKKGDRIKLALVRKGAEQNLEVTLGEIEAPAQPEWPRAFGFHAQPVPGQPNQWQFHGQIPVPNFHGGNAEEWQKTMREYQDRAREWMEKNQPQHFHPRPEKPADRPKNGAETAPALPLPKTAEKAGVGKPPAISVRPGFPIQVFGGSGLIRIDNGEGEVTIQVQNGRHTISIENSDGEKVYQGDYDPQKGVEALPKEAREQLKKMKLDDLKVLGLPGAPKTEAEGKAEIKIEIESGKPESAPGSGSKKGDDGKELL